MKAGFIVSFKLCFFLVGAIFFAVLSIRAGLPIVTIGLGVAAFFMLVAAFREYRALCSRSLDESSRGGSLVVRPDRLRRLIAFILERSSAPLAPNT